VHRADCPNLARLDPERLVEVSWGHETGHFQADIDIRAVDRPGLLRDLSSILAAQDINVLAAHTHTDRRSREAHLRLTLELADRAQLERALARLAALPALLDVRRV